MSPETSGQTDFCIVLTTTATEADAEALAQRVVLAGLGACVQVQRIKSFYLWKGEACADPEHLLLIKTRKAQYHRLEDFIRTHHSYETPEIVQIPIEAGSDGYLEWVAANSVG